MGSLSRMLRVAPLPWLQASEPFCRTLQTESRLPARRHSGGGRMQRTCSGRSRSCSRSEHRKRPYKRIVTAGHIMPA